jgi:EpsD family peptidyl-prolyl cis-trans isomerase
MPTFFSKSHGLPMALVLSTVLLAACGEGKPPATQVVAKVNKDEITSHQIDYVASKARITPETAATARRQILEQLVDQQIAVQQAIERKLDRSPEVIAALDLAKREVLARAYYAQVAGSAAEPTEAETQKFYSEHPELFSQRRIYSLQEITVPAAKAPKTLLRDQVAANRPLPEIAERLKKENVPHTANAAKVATEQVPAALLPQLQQLKDGQNGLVETPQAVYVLRVAGSQSAPVDEKTALPAIRQHLTVQRNREAVTKTMAELKQRANIEYLNEYASPAPAAAAPAGKEGQTAAAAKPVPSPGIPPVASSGMTETRDVVQPSVVQPSASNIENGVKGLR